MEMLGLRRGEAPERQAQEAEARQRLYEQERRMEALDRVVEVIQRDLPEDGPHAVT